MDQLEISTLFEVQTKKYDFLNQQIENYNFKVISTLNELNSLANTMGNCARTYFNKIVNGRCIILTISHKYNPSHFTNFCLNIRKPSLWLDHTNLKIKHNYRPPQHMAEAFKKFADQNHIKYEEIKYLKQEVVSL